VLARALRAEARLDRVGERQVHVVAAEQDVVADRDAGEPPRRPRRSTAMSEKSVVPPPTSNTRS
jgi:hypothetical protein